MIYVTIDEIIEHLESRSRKAKHSNGDVIFKKHLESAITELKKAKRYEL